MDFITNSLSTLLWGDGEHQDKGEGEEKAKAKADVAEPVPRPQVKYEAATPRVENTIAVAPPAYSPQGNEKVAPPRNVKLVLAARRAPRQLGTLKILPPAIRRKIYEALLLTPHTIIISKKRKYKRDQGIFASLFRVNETIRKEVVQYLRTTQIPFNEGFAPGIWVSYVKVFNPAVTSFRIITTRAKNPLTGQWQTLSLWHTLLILYQCDMNHQLFPTRPQGPYWKEKLRGPRKNGFNYTYFKTQHFEIINRIMARHFKAETGLRIQLERRPLIRYDSAEPNDQLVRIPYSKLDRILSSGGQVPGREIKGEDLIKEVCRALRDNSAPATAAGTLPSYHANDEAKCLAWPLLDYTRTPHLIPIFRGP